MTALLAHIALFGRHRASVRIGGLSWGYCIHRSHGTGAACWRWAIHDSYCAKHTLSCRTACPPDPFADFYDTDDETTF